MIVSNAWYVRATLSLCAMIAAPGFVRGAPQTWEIDESNSTISISIPDQDINVSGFTVNAQLRNQVGSDGGPWNVGNTASVDGQIITDYVDGASIQFVGGTSNIVGLNSGSYRPNPASWDAVNEVFTDTTTAPGVFGGRLRGTALSQTADAGFLSFRNVLFELDSTGLSIGGGGDFAANTLTFGMQSADLDFDGLFFLLAQLDDKRETLDPFLGTNTVANGMIDSPDPLNQPLLRRLVLPINMPFAIDASGNALNGSLSGTLVATTTLVPEPGSFMLAALGGAVLLAGLRHTRRKRFAATS